jgi:hypothetical protein
MKERDALLYGGLAIGAYLLWRQFSGSIGGAVSSATAPLANFYAWLTSQSLPIPQGMIVFPDNTTIPASQLPPITWYGNAATFIYNGNVWQLLSHDANGNYPAIAYVGA